MAPSGKESSKENENFGLKRVSCVHAGQGPEHPTKASLSTAAPEKVSQVLEAANKSGTQNTSTVDGHSHFLNGSQTQTYTPGLGEYLGLGVKSTGS